MEALEALGPAMGNNSTSSHQLIIARLGQMGDPRATPVLLDLLDSTNRSVAQQTVQALAQLKDPLATERIIEIANGPDNYAKQYLNGYINNGSNNGFPGVRKTEDGTYKMRKAETMSRLIKARQRMVARLEERYGPYNAKTKPAKGGDVQDLKKDEETGAPIAGKKQTAVAVEPEGGLDER